MTRINRDLIGGTKCSSKKRLIEIQLEQRYLRSMLLLNKSIFDFLSGFQNLVILITYNLDYMK